MTSKTPQFDALLQPILDALVPHTRACRNADKLSRCEGSFYITEEDIDFYKILRVPPPALCPTCRNRQRLSFANYSNIYKRQCDVPGHDEMLISPVPPVMPWITYDYEAYLGDSWNPRDFGKRFNPEKDFFDQFLELEKVVPQPGVRRGADSPNSDYSFYGKHMKDCYYVFGGRRNEDIMYGASIFDSKHLIDCYFTRDIEIGYAQVSTESCYKCKYVYFSSQCVESDFMYDCRNCQNCFGCVNLRNKNYCFFNQQLSKEEYFEKIRDIDLGKRSVVDTYEKEFWSLVRSSPVRALRIFQSDNVQGNDVKRSKNCFGAFQVEDSENVRYAYFAVMKMKDSMDANHGGHGEFLYNTQNVASATRIKCSFAVKESADCEYVMTCTNCHDCFGCIGLENASYCILNTQYEPEEYFRLLDAIKSRMLLQEQYGDFLPMSFSPIAYNSSMAQIMYPLSENEVLSNNLYWQEEKDVDISSLSVLSDGVSDSIDTVDEALLQSALISRDSGRPYRVLVRELSFYKQYRIPLPVQTPHERMLARFQIENNFRTSKDTCASCSKTIDSAYASSDGWHPYCETCYQKEIL